MAALELYPFGVFVHILGALGLFVALALECFAAGAALSTARVVGAVSMALLAVPGMLMTLSRWSFFGWPMVGLIGMAMMVAVGLALGRRPALRLRSVQIRIAIGLGVIAVMVFKLNLYSSLVILASATLLGIGTSLILGSRPRRASAKLRSGGIFPAREMAAISGERMRVPDPTRLVHLQFRRFAGCPVCSLHLRSIVRRHAEINQAGIREVVVFHSGREELLQHAADLPFAVIADPDKQLYAEFGVEASPRALLDPRVWMPILLGITRSAVSILRGHARSPKLTPTGGRLGLPADFLIGTDGRLLAVKYGAHAYDQWSVDELLSLARGRPAVEISTRTGAARELSRIR